MTELNVLSAAEAARRIALGEITSEALVRACLERIEKREAKVGAWEALDAERVIAEAKRLDASQPLGSLHGVPVGVKDIIDTADFSTAYGTPIYAGHRPGRDAACVARLRSAGALVLGKTVTTEFADWKPGKTANPHDARRTPGGSSSGSAAAVADFMVPIALGTQTGGSVNRPAAFCGVVGFKPSYGVHAMAGIKVIAPTLDTLGFLARTVADAALAAQVVAGGATTMAAPTDAAPTVGMWRTPWWDKAEAAAHDIFADAGAALAHSGAKAIDLDPCVALAQVIPAQVAIYKYESARALASELDRNEALLSPTLARAITEGLAIADADYARALAVAAEARARFEDLIGDVDAIVAPGAVGEAPLGLDSTGDPLFSKAFTIFHAPAVTVPVGRGPGGMPLAVQVAGPCGADARVLAMAARLERALT